VGGALLNLDLSVTNKNKVTRKSARKPTISEPYTVSNVVSLATATFVKVAVMVTGAGIEIEVEVEMLVSITIE
jgi:hypothetical protein